MKRIILIAILAVATLHFALAQTRNKKMSRNDQAEQEVIKLEREFGEAITRGDKAALDRLTADEFVLTNTLGQIVNKARGIADITSPDYQIDSLVNDDIKVRVYGDAAVVTARGTAKGRYKGQDASGQFRYTRVWIRRQGRWRAVAAQSTAIPQQ
jgi:ketosteroid isomerase-like protein